MRRIKRALQGMTILELILVMMVIGIISAMAARFTPLLTSSYRTHVAVLESNWSLRLALFRLEREFSESPRLVVPGSNGSRLRFVSGQDSSTITYRQSGSSLVRNGRIIASSVSAFSVGYYDAALSTTTPASAVRCVQVLITITDSFTNHSTGTVVCPRNFSA